MFNGLELYKEMGEEVNGLKMADIMRELGVLCRVSHGYVMRI